MFYVATFIVAAWLRFPYPHWSGLISATIATAGAIAVAERGRWDLGFFIAPGWAAVEALLGCAWGFSLTGACALLVLVSTDLHHQRGAGFPWLEMLTTFIPAAVHEELLFRGYPFQKLHRWNRRVAIALLAFLFAMLHARNAAVTALALVNIFIGGILLALAYERYGHLWFPIGIHLSWNITIGPLLGHEVSGYRAAHTLLVERGGGPWWLTGGAFGIEGSLWMTVVELAAIAALLKTSRRERIAPAE